MTYYAGIDVSLEWSSICVVDASGKITQEAKVVSEPERTINALANDTASFAVNSIRRWWKTMGRACYTSRPNTGRRSSMKSDTSQLRLESLIDRFVEQLGQVFMLRVFHVDTIC